MAKDTVGEIEARQLIALIGRQGGRSPACGYVLAGGGLYSMGIGGTRIRRPGVALTAGIEVPVTGRGAAVQLDAQAWTSPAPLPGIGTRARDGPQTFQSGGPIGFEGAPVGLSGFEHAL